MENEKGGLLGWCALIKAGQPLGCFASPEVGGQWHAYFELASHWQANLELASYWHANLELASHWHASLELAGHWRANLVLASHWHANFELASHWYASLELASHWRANNEIELASNGSLAVWHWGKAGVGEMDKAISIVTFIVVVLHLIFASNILLWVNWKYTTYLHH